MELNFRLQFGTLSLLLRGQNYHGLLELSIALLSHIKRARWRLTTIWICSCVYDVSCHYWLQSAAVLEAARATKFIADELVHDNVF